MHLIFVVPSCVLAIFGSGSIDHGALFLQELRRRRLFGFPLTRYISSFKGLQLITQQ
jgi:hypothetical protein